MPVLKIFIVALLVFLPFGEILRIGLGNNIFLKPIDIIGALIFFWTAFLYLKEKSFRSYLHWYFFLFPFIGFISLIINNYWLKSNEFLAAFLYLIRWVIYLGSFFAVMQLDKNFNKKIVSLLTAGGFVVVLIGYIQFFLYPSLRNLYYQGWDEHLYRMFSTFFDPNFVGAFFVLYLIFIMGLLFHKSKQHTDRKMFVFYSLVSIATIVAIFLTFSRSALVMLIVSGITFLFLSQKKRLIIFLLLAVILFMFILSPFFYIDNLDLFRLHSSVARLSDIANGVRIIQDHPLIGVGFNAYRYTQIKYHFINANSPFPSHSAAGVDNSFIFVLATTGILGFAAYGYLWFKLIKKAQMTHNRFSIVFISSIVGLFVNALFNNSLFYPEIMVWIWIVAGLMFAEK